MVLGSLFEDDENVYLSDVRAMIYYTDYSSEPKRYFMIRAMTVLLVYQLVGEALVMAVDLPVPGPVMGMVFLFVTLLVRGSVPEDVQSTAQGMLRHLSLLFVPAGVGVMVHATVVADAWIWVMLTLVLSALLTLAITGWTMQLVKGR